MSTSHDFELLGPAEQEIAKQLRTAIEEITRRARKLADNFEEIDLGSIEQVLLGSDSKQAAITITAPLQGLAKNLADAELTSMLAAIFLKPSETKARS